MDLKSATRLLMLGAAPETRGSISAVVAAYRAHGLFKRWPIDYSATHSDGTFAERCSLFLRAGRYLVGALAQGTPIVVHAHIATSGFWRDAALVAPALAARKAVLLQLHGAGFERCSSMPPRSSCRANRCAPGCARPHAMRTWFPCRRRFPSSP